MKISNWLEGSLLWGFPFFWTKRPLKKEKKKDKIMVEKEQIFYKSQVVLVRKLTNLTQNLDKNKEEAWYNLPVTDLDKLPQIKKKVGNEFDNGK